MEMLVLDFKSRKDQKTKRNITKGITLITGDGKVNLLNTLAPIDQMILPWTITKNKETMTHEAEPQEKSAS